MRSFPNGLFNVKRLQSNVNRIYLRFIVGLRYAYDVHDQQDNKINIPLLYYYNKAIYKKKEYLREFFSTLFQEKELKKIKRKQN